MSETTTKRRANRLVYETSPYLLQHAHNPVDWYPWGQEAFEKAKREIKPIFLSIGYSACHWCHVMERECFADEAIAQLMNEGFVNIKVDREERPDLDHIYQTSAQLLAGQGGWPLSVFLTPDLRPFFAGTYFPPEDRFGRPGFPRLLTLLRDLFSQEPTRVERVATNLVDMLAEHDSEAQPPGAAPGEPPSRELVARGVSAYAAHFDHANAGFGGAPKFPSTPHLQLFLHQYGSAPGQHYVDLASFTLRQMAAGGLYDQLGGGFHRYSTDERWLIPHFEKMLYDNALLPPLYLAAYQITGEAEYADTARETLAYVLRDLAHPGGGFYSSEDADSEGEEGRFYVWRPEDLAGVLEAADAALASAYWGVADSGNFAHRTSVLARQRSVESLAAEWRLEPEELRGKLAVSRQRLFAAREGRARPFRDEKIITAWNALMVRALARACFVLGEERYLRAAVEAWDFLWREMRLPSGRLRRSFREGPGPVEGFLEDYALCCLALWDMYQVTGDREYLEQARQLMDLCIELFWDSPAGGFFLAPDAADLIHRPKHAGDQSIPAANAAAALALLYLSSYCPGRRYGEKVEALLLAFRPQMESNLWGTAGLLGVLDVFHAGMVEVVMVLPAAGKEQPLWQQGLAEPLLTPLRRRYLPNLALYMVTEATLADPQAPEVWRGKEALGGRATAYVCRDFRCSAPITGASDLDAALRAAWTPAVH